MIKLHIYLLFILFLTSCNWFSSPEENPVEPIDSELKLVWEIPYEHVGTEILAPPLIFDDSLIVMSAGKEIFAVKQNSGEIKWKYFVSELTNIQSQDILADGEKTYMSHVEDIRSVNLSDGSEAWVSNFHNERGNFYSHYKSLNNNLFVSGLKTIYCIDVNSGTTLWANKIIPLGQLGGVISYNGKVITSSAHSIYDSNGFDISTKGIIRWLDAETGDTLFTKKIIGAGHFQYLAIDNTNGIFYGGTYFTYGGASFEARNAETGEVIWSYYTPNVAWSYEECTITDNKVFVNLTGYGTAAFDKYSGKLLWRKGYSEYFLFPHQKPILYKGYLYVIHGDMLFIINPETGDVIYSYMPKDNGFGTFSIANDKIFICGYNKLQCYEVYKGE